MNKTQQKSYNYFYGVYCTAGRIEFWIDYLNKETKFCPQLKSYEAARIMRRFGNDNARDIVWDLAVRFYDKFILHDKKNFENMSEYDAINKFIEEKILMIGETSEKYDESEE